MQKNNSCVVIQNFLKDPFLKLRVIATIALGASINVTQVVFVIQHKIFQLNKFNGMDLF